jgi:hypothetical protein
MQTSRDNFFQNLGKAEVFHRAVQKESNPHALKKPDFLIQKTGVALVEAVKSTYDAYLADPTNPKKITNFCKWRLRLHMRCNNDKEVLEILDDARNLGLKDSTPGETCWNYDLPFQG